jgi:hypothetical protein
MAAKRERRTFYEKNNPGSLAAIVAVTQRRGRFSYLFFIVADGYLLIDWISVSWKRWGMPVAVADHQPVFHFQGSIISCRRE